MYCNPVNTLLAMGRWSEVCKHANWKIELPKRAGLCFFFHVSRFESISEESNVKFVWIMRRRAGYVSSSLCRQRKAASVACHLGAGALLLLLSGKLDVSAPSTAFSETATRRWYPLLFIRLRGFEMYKIEKLLHLSKLKLAVFGIIWGLFFSQNFGECFGFLRSFVETWNDTTI